MIMISSNLFIAFTLLLSISLPSYAAPVLDSSVNATHLNDLDRRVKIGGAKPPPKKPAVPAPAPRPPAPVLPPKQKGDPCAFLQGCSKCVAKAGCTFSKVDFSCKARTASPDLVTRAVGCPQMDQMQGIFPAVNKQTNAGVIPANIAAQFNTVSNHVFNGEPGNPTSGRHTTTAWLAANRNSRASTTNQVTHIVEFPNGRDVKTAWDSAFYSQLDIKNMCAVAIKLGLGRATAPNAGFVVQSPFGKPACIHFFTQGTGSCFPFGSASPPQKLGQQCSGVGTVTAD